MKHLIPLSFVLILFTIGACSNSSTGGNDDPQPPQGEVSYQVEKAFPNLSFNNPLYLDHAGDGTNRLFVVEQGGTIQVFENESSTSSSTTFLDIADRLVSGGERGLLGLAFHPEYETNGYFYVNYTADNGGNTVISRFEVSTADLNLANPESETILLEYSQPYSNHNGGYISFGPDGYLYIASGDGGSGGDPDENAQDRTNLLGNILRIDVDGTDGINNYVIPPDNPFVDNNEGFREEIYAYGLRNPWRFSFDPESGQLWAADVGQNQIEEIDLIQNGGNYGWDTFEGSSCFDPDPPLECDNTTDVEFPIFEYSHDLGSSVTGGYVYRGPTLSELTGQYIFGDFTSGRIWTLDISDLNNPENTELMDTDLSISSFGVDADNELYITAFDGIVYKIVEEEN